MAETEGQVRHTQQPILPFSGYRTDMPSFQTPPSSHTSQVYNTHTASEQDTAASSLQE